jgi:hypothetical protein
MTTIGLLSYVKGFESSSSWHSSGTFGRTIIHDPKFERLNPTSAGIARDMITKTTMVSSGSKVVLVFS